MNAIEWTADQAIRNRCRTLVERMEAIAERFLAKRGYVTALMVANEINRTQVNTTAQWAEVVSRLGLVRGEKIKTDRGGTAVKWVRDSSQLGAK